MKILALVLAMMATFASFGTNCADSVKVYFRVGHRQFDPSLGNNRAEMARFVSEVRDAADAGELEHIIVRAYASPDGMNKANQRLSVNRCNVIADYIAKHTGVSPSVIETKPGGIAWDELRQLVEATPDVPSREKVLDILENTPVWVFDSAGRVIDGRKKQLMDLGRGIPYRWMLTNLFPVLRNAVAVSLYTNSKEDTETEHAMHPEQEPLLPAIATYPEPPEEPEAPETVEEISMEEIIVPETPAATVVPQAPRSYYFAVKTNMLFDALLIPNIGAEFYLGKNISVYGDWMYGWWDDDNRHRYWRIYGGELGARWWFGHKAHAKPLTGHHLGIYAGALTFDFELGGNGYMGGRPGGTLWDRCLANAGIEYGYSLPVGSRLNIDFTIGIGCLAGNYIKYFPFDNDYYREKEYKMRFVGPTKAEISLVWLIGRGNTNKKKGGDQ